MVTLSFDNGPEPGVTPGVLHTLAKHSVKASFFAMGRKVINVEGRELAMRASAEGHWVGNHTYSHTRPLGELDRARRRCGSLNALRSRWRGSGAEAAVV